jgi:hypothetical protein
MRAQVMSSTTSAMPRNAMRSRDAGSIGVTKRELNLTAAGGWRLAAGSWELEAS